MQTEAEADNYKWLTPDFYSKAYDQFIRLYWVNDPFPGQNFSDYYLNPETFKFSTEEEEKIPAFFFGHSLLLLSSEHLVGQINGFHSDIYKLKAWEQILSRYNESQRLHLIDEFVEPLVTSCLLAPYALKNQIIFTGTQAAILLNKNQRSKIPRNHQINYLVFEKWAGAWPEFPTLAAALAALADKEFNGFFRDRYTHQLPPRIEIGVAPNYRFAQEGQIKKIFGGNEPPLPLSKAVETAVIQHRASVDAFRAFWAMLKNKLKSI